MTEPARQPAGVPSGGQFTSTPHPESEVSLAAPVRHEAFPLDSPAANVRAFHGKPVDRWFDLDAKPSLILPDGSYGTVHPDHEDTGHWFADVTLADGSYADGGCWDSPEAAMRGCEQTLRGEH